MAAQNCDVYLLETYVDSNNNKVEKKTLVSNMLEYPMILQKGDNTVVFEVSRIITVPVRYRMQDTIQ